MSLQAYTAMLIYAVKTGKISARKAKRLMNQLIEQEIK